MNNRLAGCKFYTPFIISFIMIVFSVALLLPLISQSPQIYYDLIIEVTARQGLNKSGELKLFVFLLCMSCMLTVIYYCKFCKMLNSCDDDVTYQTVVIYELCSFAIAVPVVFVFFFFGTINQFSLFVCLILILIARFSENINEKLILLLICIYFLFVALAATNCFINVNIVHNEISFIWYTIIAFIVLLTIDRFIYNKLINTVIICSQIAIPLMFMLFIVNRFKIENKIISVSYDNFYIISIYFIIAITISMALYNAYKVFKSNQDFDLKKYIFPSTIIAICCFNTVDSPLLLVPSDWHHEAECYVPFQQIFDFNKTLFKDFFSASGCFPMVFGFIQQKLLGNSVTAYKMAHALVKIFACGASGYMLFRIFGAKISFFLVLFIILISDYNRSFLLLPFLLVLMLPQLVHKKHAWLQAYIILSMLLGLYYPLYGGAYVIGCLPFAIAQLVHLARNPQLENRKKVYLSWGVLFAIVLFFSPLLYRLAQHTLMMSSQTVLADGIAIFDHSYPAGFLTWLNNQFLKKIIYLCLVYILPIFFVMIFVSLTTLYILNCKAKYKYTSVEFLGFSFGILFLCVCYTYSLVRMDYGGYLFRSGPPILAASVILVGFLCKNGCKILNEKTVIGLVSIVIAINYAFGGATPPVHANKLTSYKTLGADWVEIQPELTLKYPKLGKGFVQKNVIENIRHSESTLKNLDNVLVPIANLSGQMQFFIFDKNAAATGTTYIVRSSDAQNYYLEIINQNRPIFMNLNSMEHYVIYRYIMDSNYVFYNNLAIPAEYRERILNPQMTEYTTFYGYKDMLNICNALGRSMSTLSPLFTQQDVKTVILSHKSSDKVEIFLQLAKAVGGKEVDFIFLHLDLQYLEKEFFDLKKYYDISNSQYTFSHTNPIKPPKFVVTVYWKNNEGMYISQNIMTMALGNGELLLPLGANPYWLTGTTNEIKIEISGKFKEKETIGLSEVQFLQYDNNKP